MLALAAADRAPIIGQDEARFAQATREMRQAGEWVVPTFAGEPRYDKPILIYWLMGSSFAAFGETAGAARLPSALASALTLCLVAAWARRRWGRGAGLLAVLLAMASPVLFVEARASTADGVLLLATTVAMAAMWRRLDGGGERWAVIFWVAIAAAILTKGPVAPLVALATLAGLWALERAWRRTELAGLAALAVLGYAGLGPLVLIPPAMAVLASAPTRERLTRLGWWWGVPLVAALVLPWAVAAHLASDGAYFASAIGRHVVERSLSGIESHGGFPGFYPVTAVLVAHPWWPLALLAWAAGWRKRADDGSLRYLMAWLMGPLLVLEMVETRMVHYLLPAYPAGVLLVVGWLRSRSAPLARWARWWLAVVGLLLAGVPAVVVVRLGVTELAGEAALAAVPMVIAALILVGAGERMSSLRSALVGAAGSLLFLLVTVGVFIPALSSSMIAPRAAAAIEAERRSGESVIAYKLRDDELLFQSPGRIEVETSAEAVAARLSDGEDLLVASRQRDLERLLPVVGRRSLVTVARVEGVDLGRGRWAEMVLLRPAAVP